MSFKEAAAIIMTVLALAGWLVVTEQSNRLEEYETLPHCTVETHSTTNPAVTLFSATGNLHMAYWQYVTTNAWVFVAECEACGTKAVNTIGVEY